jgi:hypothetical protein
MIATVKRAIALTALMVLAGSACGEDQGPQAGPTTSPTLEDVTETSPGSLEWLAVFETAEDSTELQDIQDEIISASPENVAVAPAGCWEEVPEELDLEEDDYVAGVVASSPEDLRRAVDAVGREPVFEGQVTLIACD